MENRILENGTPRLGTSSKGKPMHYSVGALIERAIRGERKYLLIDRVKEPLGYAGIAGHVDKEDGDINKESTWKHALYREVREESKMKVEQAELIFAEEVDGNRCSKGIDVHFWCLYSCKTSGKPVLNPAEAKSIGWYSVKQIKKFGAERRLEPVWNYWFEKLGII